MCSCTHTSVAAPLMARLFVLCVHCTVGAEGWCDVGVLRCRRCGCVCEHQDIEFHAEQCFEAVLCDEHLAIENALLLADTTEPADDEPECCGGCGGYPELCPECRATKRRVDMAEDLMVDASVAGDEYRPELKVRTVKPTDAERTMMDILMDGGKLAKYVHRINQLLRWQPQARFAIANYKREIVQRQRAIKDLLHSEHCEQHG